MLGINHLRTKEYGAKSPCQNPKNIPARFKFKFNFKVTAFAATGAITKINARNETIKTIFLFKIIYLKRGLLAG